MRKLLLTIVFLLVVKLSYATSYHVVYIRVDNSMSYESVASQVDKVLEEAGDSFIIIYSNEAAIIPSQNWKKQKLQDYLNAQLSNSAIVANDEIELLSSVIEEALELEIVNDEFGYPTIRSKRNFNEIYLHCFVGKQFIDNRNTIDVIEKVLLVNGLNSGELTANLIYYPCEAEYDEADIQLSRKYQLDNQPILK